MRELQENCKRTAKELQKNCKREKASKQSGNTLLTSFDLRRKCNRVQVEDSQQHLAIHAAFHKLLRV